MKKQILTVLFAVSLGWVLETRSEDLSFGRRLGNNIADTVDKVMPSVVVLRTEAIRYHLARDWFFDQVYKLPERLAGQGSGVVISRDGYVLTSEHVIRDAQEVEVVLQDGTKYPARIIGRDSLTDLAVVQIVTDTEDVSFTPISFGDSDRLRVGEFVIAMGSPFSLDSSVTFGIVSQKGRRLGRLPFEDFIQTDASINPGNSGGPLVDIDGYMIGVNAVIQTANPAVQGNIGIGFAIPVNLARRVADSIIEHGRFIRPWIGIRPVSLSLLQGAETELYKTGVFVEEVYQNTPAYRAGLEAGDIILTVDGTAIDEVGELQKEVLNHHIGESVLLTIRRDKDILSIKMIVEAMPPAEKLYQQHR